MLITTKKSRSSRKLLWLSAVVVVLLVAAVVVKLVFFGPAPKGAESGNTGGQSTKGEPVTQTKDSSSDTSTGSSSSTQPGDQKDNTGGTSAANLLSPSGDFISDHAPSQAHPTETSVCNTSPGASCQITFTKSGVTKSLPSQTTDRGGSTYWNNWNPTGYGLTSGSWQVQAVASLKGQTKTTSDAIPLVISE